MQIETMQINGKCQHSIIYESKQYMYVRDELIIQGISGALSLTHTHRHFFRPGFAAMVWIFVWIKY